MDSIKKRIEYIVEQLKKLDCFVSAEYLRLFQDEQFLSLLYQYIDNRFNEEICTLIEKEGIRLIDLQNCAKIVCDDTFDLSDVQELSLLDYLLPSKIHNDEIVDSAEVGKNIPEKSQEEDEFYFDLKCQGAEIISYNCTDRIIIESNLFNVSSLLSNINALQIGFSLKKTTEQEYIILKDKEIEIDSLFLKCDNYVCSQEQNAVVIAGDEFGIGDFYDFLNLYFSEAYHQIDISNQINKIKRLLEDLPYEYGNINIYKCGTTDVLTLTNDKYLSIREFVKDEHAGEWQLYNIKVIIAELQRLASMPIDALYNKMFSSLEPREYVIIRDRYLGNKIDTLESIGEKYGITRERVRQVEKVSLKKISRDYKHWHALRSSLYLISDFNSFLPLGKALKFGITREKLILLEKVDSNFLWDDDIEALIFKSKVELIQKCIVCIEKLPCDFLINQKEAQINSIGEQIAFCLTKKEMDYLLNKKYRIQGDMMIKGRIRASTILFYLMEQYYPNGIDLYDDKSIDFLREKAMENFDGFELSENNRALRARIQDCCIPIGRGIWKVDRDECLISQSLKDDINNYIESYKIPIVPVTAIFNKFSTELCIVGIANRYFLQGQLKKVVLPCYTLTRDYVLKSENADLYSLVEQYVKNTEGIITKNDIQREFPGITDVTIQMIAQATGVLNMNGYYVHIDNLGLTESDIALLKTQIDDVLNDGAIHHVKSIFNKAKKLTAGLLLRIGINHYLQFYYLIHELFSDEYEFNRPYIAKLGIEVISGERQLVERILMQDITSFSDIRSYAKEIGLIIDRYIQFVDRNNDSFIFMDKRNVVTLDYLQVTEETFLGIDDILKSFIGDRNFRPLNEFFDYWLLPKIKVAWNEWLLYSVINKYSEQYNATVSSNTLAEAVPILISEKFDESTADFSQVQKIETKPQEDFLDMLDIEDLE